MRFLHVLLQFFFLFVCLWLIVTPCTSDYTSTDVLCLSGENHPRLRSRNSSLVDTAVARAYLSPAVFLGTLKSVLVQRDGTVRAWFSVDSILKMSEQITTTDYNNRRRKARTTSRTTNYTRVSYSRNKYIGDFVSLPAVRPRNPSDMYRSTYYRAMTISNRTPGLSDWTEEPEYLSRSTRTVMKKKADDTEVVYNRSGRCVLEVNQDNLRLGGQYLVFGVPVKRHSWPSLIASALPIPNDKRTLRAIKKVLCTGCAKPPSIEGLDSVRVEEGSRARLHCHLAGNPIPWVEWYKDGRKIANRTRIRVKTKRRTSTLVIRRARTLDRGVYECRAGNVVRSTPVSAKATMVVKRRRTTTLPPPTTISTSTQSSPWTTEPCTMSHFCNNGGTCIFYKHIGEYVCHCAEGYVGLRCDYKDVRVAYGQARNPDRLLIAIVILFLVFFCLHWATLVTCWLCCFRNHKANWEKLQEMAPLRYWKNRSENTAPVNGAMELTSSSQSSSNGEQENFQK